MLELATSQVSSTLVFVTGVFSGGAHSSAWGMNSEILFKAPSEAALPLAAFYLSQE